MSLKQQGINAAQWSFLGTIINPLRNFIVSIFLARLLMPEDFGVIGLAMVFAGMMDQLVDLGFGRAIIQKKDVTQEQLSTVFFINMIVGVFLSVVMFVTSPLVATFFKMPILSDIVKVMSATFVIKSLNSIQSSLFTKVLDFKKPFVIQLCSGLASGSMGIGLAYFGWGVWALVFSQVSGWIISTIIIWLYSNWRPSWMFNFSSVKDLWQFGYKISLTITIDIIASKLDTLVIGKAFSAQLLGFYYRAQSLNRLVVQYSFKSFSDVLFPSFSKIQDNIPLLRTNVLKVIQVVSFTTFFFSGLMYVCANEIIIILYGIKWLPAISFFKILGVFTFCFTLPTVLNVPIQSMGKSGKLLKLEIIKKILLLLSILIGLHFGIYGYVYAINIAALFGMMLNISMLKKLIDISVIKQITNIILYAFPFGVLCVLFEYQLPDINVYSLLFIKGSVYIILYILYNFLLKTEGFLFIKNLCVDAIKKHK